MQKLVSFAGAELTLSSSPEPNKKCAEYTSGNLITINSTINSDLIDQIEHYICRIFTAKIYLWTVFGH